MYQFVARLLFTDVCKLVFVETLDRRSPPMVKRPRVRLCNVCECRISQKICLRFLKILFLVCWFLLYFSDAGTFSAHLVYHRNQYLKIVFPV